MGGVVRSFTGQAQPRFQVPVQGIGGAIQRFLPGGSTGFVTVSNQQSRFRPGAGGAFEDVLRARQFGRQQAVQGPGAVMQGGNGCAVHPSCQPKCKPTRWNKSGYYVQSVPGQPEAGGTWIPPESMLVAVRRRNLSNGRANTRALSRTVGLARQVKRLQKASRTLAQAVR